MGGSLVALLWAFAGALAATAAFAVWRRGRRAPSGPAGVGRADTAPRPSRALRAVGAALALAGAIALSERPLVWWWWALALLCVAFALAVWREPPLRSSPAASRGRELALWALALAGAGVALAAHRVDIDDSFYVNLAVAAADAPGVPLLAQDTLHGVAGLPVHHPAYRVHSWEIGNGAVSYLTGLPAIAVFHFVSTAAMALLVPLAFARLFRLLAPGHWPWAVAATVAVLLTAGDVHRFYANFAYVRIWQGKSVFLMVLLPLIQAYALELATRPSRGAFARLFGAQVAAVGCTSTAVWAAPAAALAAAAAGVPLGGRAWRRLALVLLASTYVLGAGIALRHAVLAERAEYRAATADPALEQRRQRRLEQRAHLDLPGSRLERAFDLVLGDSRLRVASLAAAVGTWALCGAGLARRFSVVVPLAIVLVVLNPYAAAWLGDNAIGPSYWRALWLLPLPALLGLSLAAPRELLGRRPWVGRAAALAALALFAALVPSRQALSPGNQVTLGWPRLKVHEAGFRFAQILTEQAPAGAVVVAPMPVAVWLPTLHDRVYPLVARDGYIRPFRDELGREDVALRLLMTRYVAGAAESADADRAFALGLQRYPVAAVFLRVGPRTGASHAALGAAGFRRVLSTLGYELWVRP
jgi:hypothetical protein